ncbi:tetratricopeptide repeat protein [Kitasatospora purpeofusca]|uniref:tetratricopeptide repeat protein n=1 Tax=Kitasatospora purpeofusca TaxID=67352 RepID=UPI003F4A9905
MANGADRVRNEISGSDIHGNVFQGEHVHVSLGQPGRGPAPTALASLPPLLVDPVGRADASEALLGLLAPAAAGAGPVVVSAVAGLAGVGKSTLALAAAHEAVRRGWFPGGVLYVELHGYRPGAAVSGDQALGALLRALGVREDDVPPTAEEQAGLYRSELARLAAGAGAVLVLADDASAAEQVAPLVPADSCHRLLVTSRDNLHSPAFPARLLPLGVLGAAEAGELVARALRRARKEDRRSEDEPKALAAIAEHCGYLPLALQIAAALLADDPGTPLVELAKELADTGCRLDALRHGNGGMPLAVAGAFELLYRRLGADAARVLRLSALNPGPDVSTEAVAAVAELGRTTARRHLAALARANLLAEQPVGSGRWRAHDLVRLYTRRLLEQDGEEERTAAWGRLWRYYLDAVRAAGAHLPGQTGGPGSADNRFPDQAAAFAWFDSERANLTAVLGLPTTEHRAAVKLGVLLTGFLSYRNRPDETLDVARRTLRVAQAADEPRLVAAASLGLSLALHIVGRSAAATETLYRASELLRDRDDLKPDIGVLRQHGMGLIHTGRFEEGVEVLTRALTACREQDDRHLEADTSVILGSALNFLGRHDDALALHTSAVALWAKVADPHLEAEADSALGSTLLKAGRHAEGLTALLRAHRRYHALGDRHSEILVLSEIALALLGAGRYWAALEAWQEARSACRDLGSRFEEANVLQGLSIALELLGRTGEAADALTRALKLYKALGLDEEADTVRKRLGKLRRSPRSAAPTSGLPGTSARR